MENEPKARFTGIFIPVEILEMRELSPLDQILLSWINSLYCKEMGGCFASNEYLADRLNVKPNTIVKSIIKLRQMGLIENVSFNGRRRVIRAKISDAVEKKRDYQTTKKKSQSHAACDLNHMQTVTKITPSSYIDSKEERKDIPGKKPVSAKAPMSRPANADRRRACFLFDKIKELDPKTKTPNFDDWESDIEKIVRIDSRTNDDIKKVIEWTFNNSFWRKNILSARKLRENFQKLWLAMQEENGTPKKKIEDAEQKKQGSLEKNKEWADKFLKNKHFDDTQNRVVLRENAVDVTINGQYKAIGFLENDFREQVEYFYSKVVNNKEVMCR